MIKRFSNGIAKAEEEDRMNIIHKKTGKILCKFTEKEKYS